MTLDGEPVYLDYAATTPLDARVRKRMQAVQDTAYFNPASNHVAGRRSASIVEEAAQQLAKLLNVAPSSLVWTSGATESNNLALIGAARQRAHRGKHLITMRTEHKAVIDVFRALEKQGFDVTWLNPDKDGRLPLERFEAALRDDTQLASVMHINNETGVIQDIHGLGEICRSRDVLLHVDGAQSVGKVPLDLTELPIDLMSMTAHKFYGPKGIGALYIADGTPLEPQLFGGGQQRRLRPGTLPVDLIAGLGEAAAVACERLPEDWSHLSVLKDRLWAGLQNIDGITLTGQNEGSYPGILNVGIQDIEGESLMLAMEPICVATGSACNSQSQEPSYVLRALGMSDKDAQSAIRFSLGRPTRVEDVDLAIETYLNAVSKLREIAPGPAA